MDAVLAPGSWLGLMGGGQLGRMFAMAAQSLGYHVLMLDPQADSPAGAVCDEHLVAGYDDQQALEALASKVSAVTTEFENVPAQSLAFLATRKLVTPAAQSVAIAQDRILEKTFIAKAGAAVAPHQVVRARQDIEAAPEHLFPGVLKSSRLGYDGKGQVRVEDRALALAAFKSLHEVPCVLEKRLSLAFEISVVLARAVDGSSVAFPVAENIHRDGILHVTRVPSPRIDELLARRAVTAARQIAEALQYQGVLCVEFFVLTDGTLIVNEMAPRPHNSGHYSIDACVMSQFEAQVRVLTGAPLGSTYQHSAAVMLNLLGDLWLPGDGQEPIEPDWRSVLAHPFAKLHLYGKRCARRGRKMGHITVLGDDPHAVWVSAREIAAGLGMAPF